MWFNLHETQRFNIRFLFFVRLKAGTPCYIACSSKSILQLNLILILYVPFCSKAIYIFVHHASSTTRLMTMFFPQSTKLFSWQTSNTSQTRSSSTKNKDVHNTCFTIYGFVVYLELGFKLVQIYFWHMLICPMLVSFVSFMFPRESSS